jgi:hypothetical protein
LSIYDSFSKRQRRARGEVSDVRWEALASDTRPFTPRRMLLLAQVTIAVEELDDAE